MEAGEGEEGATSSWIKGFGFDTLTVSGNWTLVMNSKAKTSGTLKTGYSHLGAWLLASDSQLCHLLAVGPETSHFLSVPQCPHLENKDENNGTYFVECL